MHKQVKRKIEAEASKHVYIGHWQRFFRKYDDLFLLNLIQYLSADMQIVQNFTLPDFQAKFFTLSISPNVNSFSDKSTKKISENGKICTAGKNFNCRRQWREGQISPLIKCYDIDGDSEQKCYTLLKLMQHYCIWADAVAVVDCLWYDTFPQGFPFPLGTVSLNKLRCKSTWFEYSKYAKYDKSGRANWLTRFS